MPKLIFGRAVSASSQTLYHTQSLWKPLFKPLPQTVWMTSSGGLQYVSSGITSCSDWHITSHSLRAKDSFTAACIETGRRQGQDRPSSELTRNRWFMTRSPGGVRDLISISWCCCGLQRFLRKMLSIGSFSRYSLAVRSKPRLFA